MSDLAEYKVIEELEPQTDRGAAIIGAAFLDERLEEAIRSRVRPIKDAIERLFEPNGPLTTLSSKIDMAHLLGFFGPRSHRDLHLIRRIRNRFAHELGPIDFTSENIASQCAELWLPQNILELGASFGPTQPRQQYLRAVNLLNGLIWSEITSDMTKGKVPPEPHFLRW